MLSLTLFAIAVLSLVANGAVQYSYSNQTAWNHLEGSYCAGNRQSPINIVTANVRTNNTRLTNLVMSSNWNTTVAGNWSNNGHTLKFTPFPSFTTATTNTFIGQYELRQFHFHWGQNSTVGSENQVDNKSYSGELHFVHENTSVANSSRYTVIAVFLQSDPNMTITGIWQNLMTTPSYGQSISIINIVYSQLLPSNLDYYYFPGSLTTPLCNEIVEWFVLQNPIRVPAQFFAILRTVQDSGGSNLTFNYRDVQPLNSRTVYQYPSASSGIVPTLTITLLVLSALTALMN